MFFTTLVLVTVDCEHDGLKECINLSHGHKSAEMGNVARLRLEEEEQVAVFLCLIVIGKETFLKFHAFLEMTGNFVLLIQVSDVLIHLEDMHERYLFQCHTVLDKEGYS